MARTATISDDQLLLQIMEVFRSEGFDGASLSKLSAATGLKRASLYHRFPGGKKQMAAESLTATVRWLEANVLAKLRGPGTPPEKLAAAARGFGVLYDGGKDPCLINLFGARTDSPTEIRTGVQALLSTLIVSIADVLAEAGLSPDEARNRAMKAIVQIQGALVVSHAFRDTAPFDATMAKWVEEALSATSPQETQGEASRTHEKPADSASIRAAVAARLKMLHGD